MNKHKGFTLIEVLLYIVLFTMVIGAIINITIFLSTSSQSTTAKIGLIEEANATFEELIRTLETGTSYNQATSELDQDFSVIEFTGGASGTDTLKLWIDESTFILQKQTNGGITVDLNSDSIQVDRFNIVRINPSVAIPIFKITMDFSNDYNETFSLTNSINFSNE